MNNSRFSILFEQLDIAVREESAHQDSDESLTELLAENEGIAELQRLSSALAQTEYVYSLGLST